MSDSRRMQRVEKELRALISEYMLTRMQGLPHKIFTVQKVICSKDLQHAKVYVSAFAQDQADEKVFFSAVTRGAGEVQQYIGKKLPMRYCPRLSFFKDETTDRILHVERSLQALSEGASL